MLIVELIKVINFVELIETIIKIIKLSYSLKLNVLTIWIREEILVICKRLYKSRKKCGYFYYLTNKYTIFHLFGLFLQRFMENLCTIHPRVIAFMIRDVMALKDIFSIFSLAGLVKFMVLFIDLSLNIKASVLQCKNFVFCFNSQVWLLQSCVCVKVNRAKTLSFTILFVHCGLRCIRRVFKV